MAIDPLPPTLLSDRVPQWWRPYAIDATSERMDGVRDRVEQLRRALSKANVVDAVAYAHGEREAGERIIGEIRSATRRGPGGYAASVSDAEAPALAAAALADQLASQPDSDLSTLVALLILSARYSGLEPAIKGMELSDYAERQLEYRSVSARRQQRLSQAPSAGAFLEGAWGSPDRSVPWLPGQDAPDAQMIGALAAALDEFAARADAEHAIVREQLDQQTWVRQSFCETAGAEWSEVGSSARPILAAVELARHTRGATPAIGAQGLLASVLGGTPGRWGVEPADAVASAGPYVPDAFPAAPNRLLFPIAQEFSRWRSEPTDEPTGWNRLSAERATQRPTETELALHAYRESLALRILRDE